MNYPKIVIPAEAGIATRIGGGGNKIPACAGMTANLPI
jgi:hypothetical protein